jgi:hypothetical protein
VPVADTSQRPTGKVETMFIQVIKGKVTDLDAFERLGDRWESELRPGAVGYLGVTEGTTDDGQFLVAARFESAEAAATNSARPEQGDWYGEMEKVVEDVTFHDCSRVETLFGGGKNDAGFVQVMIGKVKDAAKADAMFTRAADAEKVLAAVRPDVIGEVVAIHDDGSGYTDLVYFTSEPDARSAEQREMPADAQAMMQEFESALEVSEYLDLKRITLR